MIEVMYLEEAAAKGLISADEYLDIYGEPWRPLPPPKDNKGQFCVMCQHYFERQDNYRRHMRQYHLEVVSA